MSLDSDIIVDRRRIRRKLTFWRVVAALIAIAAVAAFALVATPGARAVPSPPLAPSPVCRSTA
ncbi:anti-sigma-K factor RskA [Bradyrhizobium sp. USDA 4449]